MKKRTWRWAFALNIVVLAFGAYADRPAYRLFQIENSDYVDHDYDETLDQLYVTNWDLRFYRCNGEQEYNLLPELRFKKRKANSLRIQTYKSEQIAIYRDGQLFRDDAKTRAGDDLKKDLFIAYVLTSLAKLEALPSGKTILDRLEHSPYALTIRYGTPHFWPEDYEKRVPHGMMMAQAIQLLVTLRWPEYGEEFDQIGAGGEIKFDPKMNSKFVEDDGIERSAPPEVELGHEMMHAFDGIRGLLDRRQVDGPAFEPIEVTEYRATYFENQIRKESGLHYRKLYSEGDPGSLLGKDGKPMLVPAPCLKP
jgi:hypothetical protein